MGKERVVEQHLVRRAAAAGGVAVKHVSPGRAGEPDRVIGMPCPTCPTCGRRAVVGLLELKAPGERPRPLQLARIAEWERIGVPAGWADSVPAVDEWLERLATGHADRPR